MKKKTQYRGEWSGRGRRISLLLFLTLCAALVHAQTVRDESPRAGFGPLIGFHSSPSSDNLRAMGGAALRMRLSPAFGLEGSINYREDRYLGGVIETKSWPVMATAMIYPLPVLYGAIGAGWYNTSIDYKIPPGPTQQVQITSETQQRFGWHFGGGIEAPMGIGSFVGDIRYVFLDYNFQKFPGSDGVKSNFYVISIGYLFGL